MKKCIIFYQKSNHTTNYEKKEKRKNNHIIIFKVKIFQQITLFKRIKTFFFFLFHTLFCTIRLFVKQEFIYTFLKVTWHH